MRGAFTVTWLLVSAMMAGCATNSAKGPPSRAVVMQPPGITQEEHAPYRWILCGGDGPGCRQRSAKTVLAAALPGSVKTVPAERRIGAADAAARSAGPTRQRPDAESADSSGAPALDDAAGAPPEVARAVVHFGVNSSLLDAAARRTLDALPRTGEFTVRAYTDSIGSDEYNAWLSARRAERVKEYVIRRGVEPQRVRIEALGECCFVASNESPEGRAANRRVEIVIRKLGNQEEKA